ncbi:hypothetical protein N7474_007341 [Penicillium riverlandense]|uniref:uncharacterized protein n=1 Tax=Penicillium riverlandense TaxID=1903569 RepID=UPI00254899CB|nr:uncharacterized protein N7474_007341 [Penicillium riverlandense]KAJ5815564.1 hypothetical protein N7474_007341 [Penicillium riverlandense]
MAAADMQEYDLLIIADATASMSNYLNSLNTSLPQIISVSALTDCFSRIGLLAYRDYGDKDLLEWSGWLHQNATEATDQEPDLVNLARGLDAEGGGDYPEAVKTALAKAHEVMRSDATTIILLYTDAPPHMDDPAAIPSKNAESERQSLSQKKSYSGSGPIFLNWIAGSNALRSGPKHAQVFAILQSGMRQYHAAYYNFLATLTGGACVHLNDNRPASISKVTVDILLNWMGVEKAPVSGASKELGSETVSAELSRYISINGIKQICREYEHGANSFFAFFPCTALSDNLTSTGMTVEAMKKYLPKKEIPVMNFAERWKTDAQYKDRAVKQLIIIIREDVRAIALNPVFGTMWRALCSDRTYPQRDEIVLEFSQHVDKIQNSEDRAQMKTWLENSYDYTEEVLAIINAVDESEQFPCVFLDPTLQFASTSEDGDEPISALTRADLLEIGRSCNAPILRRVGRVLTQLTFVRSASEMPEHIAAASAEQVPRIPLALASEKYGRQFWKMLFHLIVPGTRLSGRPAALVAALSIRMGVTHFTDIAASEMLVFKDRWNDISVPENWNVGCLTLLMDADEGYNSWQADSASMLQDQESLKEPVRLLKKTDRKLFEQLVAFKILELNLDTPLTAHVPWTPQKSSAPIGPLATCRSCQYIRSVTVMGNNSKCGICLATDYATQKDKEKHISAGVSRDVECASEATWVECGIGSCRAQYIVYNVDALNVRAKCHYCRTQQGTAPVVACKKCSNRMIWPKAYRPSSFHESEFICPPCTSGHNTITGLETTAREISTENTFSWLIEDAQNAVAELFKNHSLFSTASNVGTTSFLSRIKLFPSRKEVLTHRGKRIHNADELASTIHDMVIGRKTSQIDCSLCFSTFHPGTLNPACGRRGCIQRICTTCLSGWYGQNAPGSVINTAALACPFCRRYPTPRTLAKYGMGIQGVRGLADALRDKGISIYAWCQECASAKEYMQRTCARGTPQLANWSCYECVQELERQRLAEERRTAEELLTIARLERNMHLTEEAERQRDLANQKEEERRMRNLAPCPRCKAITEKISGCGHMSCPICGTEWCFFCVKEIPDDIYDHMARKHGGIFQEGFEREVVPQRVQRMMEDDGQKKRNYEDTG